MRELASELADWLEGEDFYNLMQTYRHAPMHPHPHVILAYGAVKDAITEMADKLESYVYHDQEGL